LTNVDIFVTEQADDQCDDSEDDDADGMAEIPIGDDHECLATRDRVHRRPADTSNAVEQGDDLGSPPAPTVPCRCHLTETELWPKDGSGGGDQGRENIEEYNGGDRVT
jgi:hypothetical protein